MADLTGLTDDQLDADDRAARRYIESYQRWEKGQVGRIEKFDDGRFYHDIEVEEQINESPPGEVKLYYLVICYDASKHAGILALKETEAEAEAVERRWSEICERVGIEQWCIGDEVEPEP